ncbi:MAG: MarC family protein, partial [Bryobacteraceae bacterium]
MTNDLATFLRTAFLVVAALLPIINPPGAAPIFLSMTTGLDQSQRKRMATRVGMNALILLVVAMFIGSYVLAFFGISLMAVRLGGGLLVMASGWKLLNSDNTAEPDRAGATPSNSEAQLASRAFYPLTFPLTVGPGSISVAVAL